MEQLQQFNDFLEDLDYRLTRLEEREFKAPTCQKLNDRLREVERHIKSYREVREVREAAIDELVKQAQELKMGY